MGCIRLITNLLETATSVDNANIG
jgi:hypothetical protein